ncbi:AAA domain-containing protein [Paraburkholderia steynii]|uniref:AAA domain-containing protein n=1 Tax=Paraburkholderia steynii TaxID=1245441 RepID=A0A7Z7FQ61_9BURK|nr:ATP-binding protein [Paraburkholderia steynii]SDJ36125.1 AAA domain-containing protein [Paraburkholderia steynii]
MAESNDLNLTLERPAEEPERSKPAKVAKMNIPKIHSFLEDPTNYQVQAVYHDPTLELPEYMENPLILALPPYQDRATMANIIRTMYLVPYDNEVRKWSKELRIMALSRIARNVIVLPVHIKLLEWIHVQIRQHYHRAPALGAPQNLQERYARQQSGSIEMLEEARQSHSSSLAVIGLSGLGKSTAAILAVTQFPRVIIHKEFRDKPFRGAQIVYIYETCPHNSNVGALCRSILGQVDAHLDTHYEVEMMSRRANTADYVDKVCRVLKHHAVGLLVIDEIQNALIRQEERQMLDLLVNMLNRQACPVLFLGTPETKLIAPKKSRLLRRIGAHEVCMDPFRKGAGAKGAKDRDFFLKAVTRLDFLPKPFVDKKGVFDALMTVSAGIPAFITHAWTVTQYAGIVGKNVEMVTPDLVHAATREVFGMVKGLIKAIETKDYKTLALIGDAALGELRDKITHWVTERDSTEFHAARMEQQTIDRFYATVRMLMELGFGRGDAERDVGTVQKECPEIDAKETLRRVLDMYRDPKFKTSNGSSSERSEGNGRKGAEAQAGKPGEEGAPVAQEGGSAAFGTFNRRKGKGDPRSETAQADRSGSEGKSQERDVELTDSLDPASAETI